MQSSYTILLVCIFLVFDARALILSSGQCDETEDSDSGSDSEEGKRQFFIATK